ncbi:PREDICTED: uncharacterized protein LOC108688470 isoform X2 [Atta colombica]|uniref:uncharacterized protein LOC108688470 isoform X2 n=1 Tax=Atta colombica TaxID=520822 RepID=UPI00084C4CC3|nr:PREDICTED: uncharacterized protein LOC108688470 isoform X2 [Atta colombica]
MNYLQFRFRKSDISRAARGTERNELLTCLISFVIPHITNKMLCRTQRSDCTNRARYAVNQSHLSYFAFVFSTGAYLMKLLRGGRMVIIEKILQKRMLYIEETS